MSVKLFVETNLDTSLFLLFNPETEIKQVRGKNSRNLVKILEFYILILPMPLKRASKQLILLHLQMKSPSVFVRPTLIQLKSL
jgi:hypothetical protein